MTSLRGQRSQDKVCIRRFRVGTAYSFQTWIINDQKHFYLSRFTQCCLLKTSNRAWRHNLPSSFAKTKHGRAATWNPKTTGAKRPASKIYKQLSTSNRWHKHQLVRWNKTVFVYSRFRLQLHAAFRNTYLHDWFIASLRGGTLSLRFVCLFFCFYLILTQSAIYYWTDAQQHETIC